MTHRTFKIAKFSALVFAAVAAVALATGVATAEPKRDGVAPAANDSAQGGKRARAGKSAKGAKGGRRAHADKGGKGHGAGRLFQRFDANQDGALQKGEVPAPVWQRIGVADANSDASITKAELRQARKDGKLTPPRGRRGGKARRG